MLYTLRDQRWKCSARHQCAGRGSTFTLLPYLAGRPAAARDAGYDSLIIRPFSSSPPSAQALSALSQSPLSTFDGTLNCRNQAPSSRCIWNLCFSFGRTYSTTNKDAESCGSKSDTDRSGISNDDGLAYRFTVNSLQCYLVRTGEKMKYTILIHPVKVKTVKPASDISISK